MARKQATFGQPAVYNATPPTLVDGDNSALNVDASGVLKTTVIGGSADGSPVTEAPVLTGAEYNVTPPTYDDGDKATTQSDVNGNTRVREQYAPLYEDNVAQVAKVEQRYSPTYISTATTTTVKSGAGFLHRLIVNGGTTGTIIIYDNTAASGTIIASFDTTNAIASYEFNVTFATGLTIVTSAATKLTVAWR
jgi:hypothetical protein